MAWECVMNGTTQGDWERLADGDITTSTQDELKAVSGNKIWWYDQCIVNKCRLIKWRFSFIADFVGNGDSDGFWNVIKTHNQN